MLNWFRSKRSHTEELVDATLNVRCASIRMADGVDAPITAVSTTDAPVPMFDFERMEVVDEILVADGGSFPERMPLLDTHDRSSVFKVFGSAVNPTRQADGWVHHLEFDDDDESSRAKRKVQKKHVRDVSIGYDVHEREFVPKGQERTINGVKYKAGERTLKVSTRWSGSELSLAPIGADRQAKIRSLLSIMPPEQKPQKRNDEFAAVVDDLIIDTGLPRDEVISDLAEATGLSSEELQPILSGDTVPSEEVIDGFSAVLESETNQLLELVEG